jgi:ribosomal protein S18 acetylase RimI-like enzyme
VHPDARGLGIGRALLQRLTEAAQASGVQQLRARAGNHEAAAIRFLQSNGFIEHHRTVFSRLDLDDADLVRARAALDSCRAEGVQFDELLLEPEAVDEERWRELSALQNAVLLSMPPYYDDPPIQGTGESFRRFITQEQFPGLSGRLFLASDRGRLAGFATVAQEGDVLHHGLTCVHPDARRRGLALSLKALIFDYARQQGVRCLDTGNRSNNEPIRALNRSLGYKEQHSELCFWKHLWAGQDSTPA